MNEPVFVAKNLDDLWLEVKDKTNIDSLFSVKFFKEKRLYHTSLNVIVVFYKGCKSLYWVKCKPEVLVCFKQLDCVLKSSLVERETTQER